MASPRREVKKDGSVVWKIEPVYKGKRLKAGRLPTKTEALQWQEDRITEAKDGVLNGYRLSHAFDKFITEIDDGTRKARGARWERVRLGKFARDPIADEYLGDIDDAPLDSWIKRRREDVSDASIKREIALLQAVFKRCRKWRWMKGDPFELVTDRPVAAPHRERRPTQAEVDTLMAALKLDQVELIVRSKQSEVAVMFLLAIESGMRLSEMATLDWDQVRPTVEDPCDWYVQLEKTKNGDRRKVPLSPRALELINCLPSKGQADFCFYVSAASASSMFYTDRNKAGVEGLTFHDSRHEGASRLVRKLEFAHFVAVMGWKDPRMAMTYVNPSASELAKQLRQSKHPPQNR